MIEEWRAIPGFEGLYEVSTLGRIKSFPRKITRTCPRNPNGMQVRWYGGGILKAHQIKNGGSKFPHLALTLSKDQTPYRFLVHRLVLMTFVGACPFGMQACHNDGNGLNNTIDNLRWDTPSNNQLDRKKHGTDSVPIMKGSQHPCTKLTEDNVISIRETPYSKTRAKELAEMYDVSKKIIWNILSRKTWKHI